MSNVNNMKIVKPTESYCGLYYENKGCFYIDVENKDSIRNSIFNIFSGKSDYWVNNFIMLRLDKICRFAGCIPFDSVWSHSKRVKDITEILIEKTEIRDELRRNKDFINFANLIKCPGILTLEIPEKDMYKILDAALYHDMAEIFIGDIPRPVKNLSKVIKELENLILNHFYECRDLLTSYIIGREFIKAADMLALGFEKRAIDCGDHWSMVEGVGITPELLDLIEENSWLTV